jgi:chromosome condensin MukBEF ATPase and DNA-binding subunit MukB
MHFNQQLKQEQRKLVDNCVGLPELLTIQRETSDKTQENTERLTIMKLKVDQIEGQLADINQTMTNIQNTLTLLLNRILQ